MSPSMISSPIILTFCQRYDGLRMMIFSSVCSTSSTMMTASVLPGNGSPVFMGNASYPTTRDTGLPRSASRVFPNETAYPSIAEQRKGGFEARAITGLLVIRPLLACEGRYSSSSMGLTCSRILLIPSVLFIVSRYRFKVVSNGSHKHQIDCARIETRVRLFILCSSIHNDYKHFAQKNRFSQQIDKGREVFSYKFY